MISCIIIEDQAPAQRILQKYISDVNFLELKGTFSDVLQALQFLKTTPIDLLFLDIHLPKVSGIDFIAILDEKPHIILTTAFSDYAIKGYELDIVDYLLKPFSFERFLKSVNKVNNSIIQKNEVGLDSKKTDKTYIFIKSGHELIKLHYKELSYIEASSDYTEAYSQDKKTLTSLSLKNWLLNLPPNFVQIHKSFIINIEFIEKVAGNLVYLTNGKQIPIGRAYKDNFISNYL
ncbi:LytTR family DNA-binding domain-containing protein [uncultured Tenacibaculum sp.]|uniref:LytR/AlgR family response regulator transcription factor n=1 Tax=uncultured Tenacibaculum sp. TaxID=174713 RepID=UPI002608FA67|nr:LytTR family DNA-binding domain-containing protein [uncultured Tenacibaculum sp.]